MLRRVVRRLAEAVTTTEYGRTVRCHLCGSSLSVGGPIESEVHRVADEFAARHRHPEVARG